MLQYSFIKDKQGIGSTATYVGNERKGAIVPLFIQVNPSTRWIGCWRAEVDHIIRNEKQENWFKFLGAARLTVEQTACWHWTSWEKPK